MQELLWLPDLALLVDEFQVWVATMRFKCGIEGIPAPRMRSNGLD
jgi:hypothetical protein